MYRLVPFKREHLDVMDMRPHETTLISQEDFSAHENGISFTGIVDGRIITCGGVIPTYKGNATAWQVPSIYVKDVSREYARACRQWLDKVQSDYEFHRLETVCLDDGLHNRWMRFLGFEREGVKRQWVNKTDYVMWGRLWG